MKHKNKFVLKFVLVCVKLLCTCCFSLINSNVRGRIWKWWFTDDKVKKTFLVLCRCMIMLSSLGVISQVETCTKQLLHNVTHIAEYFMCFTWYNGLDDERMMNWLGWRKDDELTWMTKGWWWWCRYEKT